MLDKVKSGGQHFDVDQKKMRTLLSVTWSPNVAETRRTMQIITQDNFKDLTEAVIEEIIKKEVPFI